MRRLFPLLLALGLLGLGLGIFVGLALKEGGWEWVLIATSLMLAIGCYLLYVEINAGGPERKG